MWLYILKEMENVNNVKIYGFDHLDFTDDFNQNYCDGYHYHKDINSLFLTSIQNNTNQLNLKNQKNYFKKMEEQINRYNIQPFIQEIENFQRKSTVDA